VTGSPITRVTVRDIAALKTYDPPVDALKGAEITGAARTASSSTCRPRPVRRT
jgi:formamidopyrimidine-DNA glycosylase